MIFCLFGVLFRCSNEPPNGERYLRVGGTRQRCFAGTNFKPRKRLENAATPTRRVHAVLGGLLIFGLVSGDLDATHQNPNDCDYKPTQSNAHQHTEGKAGKQAYRKKDDRDRVR